MKVIISYFLVPDSVYNLWTFNLGGFQVLREEVNLVNWKKKGSLNRLFVLYVFIVNFLLFSALIGGSRNEKS